MTDGEPMTRQEVETLIDQRVEGLRQELMRNQRMLKSLQEEVQSLRDRVEGSSEETKGKREFLDLEHKVLRAVAEEITKSSKNVADPEAVKERVAEQDYLKTNIRLKIDDLVDRDVLIEQSSGDLVFMDPELEDLDVIDSRYGPE